MNLDLEPPVILVNYKTYLEGLGEKADELSRIAERVHEETGVTIAIAPQYLDLRETVKTVTIPVFAQNVDCHEVGAHTGSVSMESLKDAGATGSLLNHSEKRIRLSDIGKTVTDFRKAGLISVVCADTALVSSAAAALKPDMVAIEPPELIGTGIAVSKAKPEILTDTISLITKVNPSVTILCGAGITKGEDIASALKLGMKGVLVASGIVKAKDREAALTDLADAARKACS
ncbi:triose-phosphate isomerase [[Eubacterium] cellulosolvens]